MSVVINSMPQVWNKDIRHHCQTYLHLCCIAWPNHLLLPLHQAWKINVTVWRQWTKEDSICVFWYAFVRMSVCVWHTSKHNLPLYASICSQYFGHVHTPRRWSTENNPLWVTSPEREECPPVPHPIQQRDREAQLIQSLVPKN